MTDAPPVGQPAPDFALRNQHGETVRLSEARGERNLALVFYPFAFSGICTGELCEIRDNLDVFEAGNVQVVGISCDPMHTLRAFAEAEKYTFPLLSDFWPHGAVAQQYGVFNDETGAANRSTYIIDKSGTVRWTVHNEMPQARDLSEQVQVLAGLDG